MIRLLFLILLLIPNMACAQFGGGPFGGGSSSGGGSGDTTSVGDCTSGACFDGTQGTTLTFYNSGGNGTISYDGTNISFSKPIQGPATNTPQTLYNTNLSSDSKWGSGVRGDGGNDNDDPYVIFEGTDITANNRLSIATGGVVTIPSLSVTTINSSTVTASSDTLVNRNTAETLTNKTLISSSNVFTQMTAATDSAAPSPTGGSLRNLYDLTALAQAATFAAPSGTPVHGNILVITIKDNATARTLSWNSIYTAGGVALPSTTVLSKKWKGFFMYDTTNSLNKWCLLAGAQEQ